MTNERLYISDVARLLNRRPNTIRSWEREGDLPEHLCADRDENGWRYWSLWQIEGIRSWLVEVDRRPGKGLPHYKPSPAKIEEHILNVRNARAL